MQKKYDLSVKTGSYMKDGQEKGRYENVGAVMQNDNGFFMILKRSFNPAGIINPDNKESVIISMFEPSNNNQGGQQQRAPQQSQQQAPADDFNDDIPF